MLVERCAFADVSHLVAPARLDGVTIEDAPNITWWRVNVFACGGLRELRGRRFRLCGLYVMADHRCNGTANALREARIAHAIRSGAKSIDAYVYNVSWYLDRGWSAGKTFKIGTTRVWKACAGRKNGKP